MSPPVTSEPESHGGAAGENRWETFFGANEREPCSREDARGIVDADPDDSDLQGLFGMRLLAEAGGIRQVAGLDFRQATELERRSVAARAMLGVHLAQTQPLRDLVETAGLSTAESQGAVLAARRLARRRGQGSGEWGLYAMAGLARIAAHRGDLPTACRCVCQLRRLSPEIPNVWLRRRIGQVIRGITCQCGPVSDSLRDTESGPARRSETDGAEFDREALDVLSAGSGSERTLESVALSLTEHIELQPEDALLRLRRGTVYSELAEDYLDEALEVFETAVRLDPGDVASNLFLGAILLDRGNVDGAVRRFDQDLAIPVSRLSADWFLKDTSRLGLARCLLLRRESQRASAVIADLELAAASTGLELTRMTSLVAETTAAVARARRRLGSSIVV